MSSTYSHLLRYESSWAWAPTSRKGDCGWEWVSQLMACIMCELCSATETVTPSTHIHITLCATWAWAVQRGPNARTRQRSVLPSSYVLHRESTAVYLRICTVFVLRRGRGLCGVQPGRKGEITNRTKQRGDYICIYMTTLIKGQGYGITY